MSETVYDPYSRPSAFGGGSTAPAGADSGAYDPYSRKMAGAGGYDRNMVPGKPILQTSFAQVPNREGGGATWDTPHLSQEEPAQRVRAAISDAWRAQTEDTPKWRQTKENIANAPPGVGRTAADVGAKTLDVLRYIPGALAAGGAAVGSTLQEVGRAAGINPQVQRDLTMAGQIAPIVTGGMPVAPARFVPPLEEKGPRFTGPLSPADVTLPGDRTPFARGGAGEATGIPGRMDLPSGYVAPFDAVKTMAEGKARAGEYYDIADRTGGGLRPSYNDSFLDGLTRDAQRAKQGSEVTGPNIYTQTLDAMQNMRGNPQSLQALSNIDKELGRRISAEYDQTGISEYGRDLINLRNKLREHIDNAAEGDTVGGNKAGFDALKTGRQAYSIAMRMGDLERMENIANGTLNPQQRMRTLINNYINDEAKTRGWDKGDLDLLRQAGKRGNTEEVLASLSSRLVGIGTTATMGPLAGAGVSIGTKIARDAMTERVMRQIGDLRERLGGRMPPSPNAPASRPGAPLLPQWQIPGFAHPGLLGITQAAGWGDENQ